MLVPDPCCNHELRGPEAEAGEAQQQPAGEAEGAGERPADEGITGAEVLFNNNNDYYYLLKSFCERLAWLKVQFDELMFRLEK